jgi:hypothetical protein
LIGSAPIYDGPSLPPEPEIPEDMPAPAQALPLIGLEDAALRLLLLQESFNHLQDRVVLLSGVFGWEVNDQIIRNSAHHALYTIEMNDETDLDTLTELSDRLTANPGLLDVFLEEYIQSAQPN